MDNHIIKNFANLSTSQLREQALIIIEEGLKAINTNFVIKQNIALQGHTLRVQNLEYNLDQIGKIYLIGIGKASSDAALALDQILGSHITAGVIIDTKTTSVANPNIEIIKGTHPKPSETNLQATQKIIELAQELQKGDLVICVVSGGGSALLCSNQKELDYVPVVYDQFVQKGGTINEMNTLRKHLSSLKGGGLAKLLQPAQVVGLIFSDIPGGQIEDVASGPTFFDHTTVADVESIIKKHQLELPQKINFIETPKDGNIFNNVKNVLLVSNVQATQAMLEKANNLGFKASLYSTKIENKIPDLARIFNSDLNLNDACIGAGEPELVVYGKTLGKGGRNQQLALESIPYLQDNQVFISIASDGVDNSEAAGAIVDNYSMEKIKKINLDYQKYRTSLDAYDLFEKTGDLILTGPTGSNVADLMISLRE